MNAPTAGASAPTYLGLDIAKRTLDLSPHPALAPRPYTHDATGHASLLTALRQVPGPIHLIGEATGG